MAEGFADPMNFKIDPNQWLGHEYESYLNKIKAFSLVDPKGYLMLMDETERKIKRDVVKNLYEVMFNILQLGIDSNGRPLFIIDNKPLNPKYMLQETNEFILSASQTIDNFLKHLLDLVLPERYTQLTEKSLGKLGNANIMTQK